jgi:regulator of replication initiation timing
VDEAKHEKEMADMKKRLAMGLQEYQKVSVERKQLRDELDKLKAPGRGKN